MKTRSKALLLTLCAVVLVVATVFGTMAYLTSTDTVENTFTVGSVKIKLDEAEVDDNGKEIIGDGAARVQANRYKLMPGHVYDKDPTVTVLKGSEESYISMLVTVKFEKALTDEKLATNLDTIFTGFDGTKWLRAYYGVSDDKTTIFYDYRYYTTVAAPDEDVELKPLFEHIAIPGEWTNEDLAAIGSATITIEAQAIQADGFANADEAWEAFGDATT